MIVEVTTFGLADADDEAAFLEVDRRVQVAAMGQDGFVRRTTARGDDGDWMVLTFWGSTDEAETGAFASDALSEVIDPGTLRTTRYETLD